MLSQLHGEFLPSFFQGIPRKDNPELEILSTFVDPEKDRMKIAAVDPEDVEVTASNTEKAELAWDIPLYSEGIGFIRTATDVGVGCMLTAVNAGENNAEMLISVEAPIVVSDSVGITDPTPNILEIPDSVKVRELNPVTVEVPNPTIVIMKVLDV